MTAIRRHLVRSALIAVLTAVGLALLLGQGASPLRSRPTAIPFPIPVYEIEAVSGSHEASLLNLPLPNVGAPQAPVPVDVNGDLLPDVTVGVNLIDAEGIFNNPPDIGEVIAPNIEINRLVTAPILTPGGDPLRINIKLTIVDLEGEQDPMTVRFGYDTGPGGSIPPAYKAVVGGLDTFFDPLVARIDTTGGMLVGLDPGVRDLGLAPLADAYQGPLTTFADVDFGDPLQVAADMRFDPMPSLVDVSFGSGESSGQRFTFAHSDRREIDLSITGDASIDGLEAEIDARIDRLPKSVAVDIGTGAGGGGGVQYAADSAGGRLADLSAEIELHPADADRPIIGRVDAESLPEFLGAEWSFTEDGAPQVSFEGSGQGIGAIEARVQNYEGQPSDFEPHVPGERQHVSIQAGPGGPLVDDTLLQARLERIRGAEVRGTDDGAITGSVRVGDGERPLEVHGELDLRSAGLPYIDATATISPLPDVIDFAITPAIGGSPDDPEGEPLTVVYEPSESIDVDTEVLVGLPGTTGALACGDPGTACAEADLRNVPTRVEARMLNLEDESRIEIDAIPREGGAPLDIFGNAVLGPVTDLGTPADSALAAPVYAEFAVQGLPRFARLRTVEGPGGGVERVDVRTCDLVYATGECEPGTDDEVAEMTFAARNFELDARPADLPPPPQSGPLYVTVTAQGLPETNELVHWEATGRLTDFEELTYLGQGDLTAARVDIGGNQDFRAFVDLDDIDLNGGDPDDGRVDVDADVLVERLPAPLTFCMAQDGRPLTDTPLDPITAACENPDPFGDDSVESGPLTIHYDAGGTFSVHTDVAIEGDLPFEQPELPIDFGEIHRIAASVDLTDIPGEFTGYVGTLVDGAVGEDGTQPTATRVRTVAPGAAATKLVLTAEVTTEGVECADPDPEPVGGEAGAVCASVVVDGLPEYASILAGTVTDPDGTDDETDALVAQEATFLACDLDLATGDCRPGTAGSIGEIDVDVRAHAGAPDGVPAYAPPADEPHVYAQADIDSLGDFEIEAGLQVFDLRELRFRQGPTGLTGGIDLGNGIDPLTVHAFADLRDLTALIPGALRAEAVADVVLDPLPQTVDLEMTSPGANQADPVTLHALVSQASLLTVDAEIREHGVPDGAECGARGTYCAGLVVDRLPNVFDATISREFSDVAADERDVETRMVVSQTRFDATKANIEVHAAIGLPIDAPIIGDGPVFADLDLVGVPDHLSVGLDSHEVLEEGTEPGTYDVAASALERVQVHTCRRDFENEVCETGSDDQLDLLRLSARTFRLRPTDFPAPLAGGPPLYVAVAGRGTDVEAVVELPEISEFQFLNRDGTTGARARVGGGVPSDPQDLQVRVDVEDLPLAPRIELGDLDVVDPRVSVDATIDVTPFPGDLAFCLRNGGATPLPPASGIPFVATCEDADPFGDADTNPLTHTPLSVGFDANDDFEVHVDAEVGVDGLDEDSNADPELLTPIETHRLFGTLDMLDLPSDLVLHFLQPGQEDVEIDGEPATIPQGPFRGLLHTEGADSGIDVAFSAGLLIGADTICEDPRPGRSATCVSLGTPEDPGIQDLPTDVEFFYDPDVDPYDPAVDLADPATMENFVLRTDGTGGYPTQVNDIRITSVNPPLELPELNLPLLGELSTDAIVVEADLGDIPQPFELRGTLLLGDTAPTAVFEVQDGNSLPGAEVHVRNFLSPDPTVGLAPPDRPVADDDTIPTYTVSAFQRGPAMRVDANLMQVDVGGEVVPLGIRQFGLSPVRSAEDRHPLGTTVIDAALASDMNVRAYVDLLPEPGFRILGDVLIGDMPAAVNVCVRGPRAIDPDTGDPEEDLPFPGTGTWCDDPGNLAPGEAGFQVDQLPNEADRTMDLDAFARLEYGGGSSVVAARVDIDEMPQIVQARFPGGFGKDVEINAFSRDSLGVVQPDGIDRIRIEAASFDLDQAATGIVGELPYSPLASQDPSLRADDPPADGREYVHAAADLSAGLDVLANIGFHARAQIGRDDGAPSSQLQSFQFTGEQCPVPLDADGDPRADYPRMPTGDGTGYTCIRVVFDDPTPENLLDDVNPLSLDATVKLPGGNLVNLHDAGLSDVPTWIQVQLADAQKFTDPANQRGWRRPCPPISETTDTDGCMAPMLRFDQPNESYLFGQVEYGQPADIELLDDASTDPNELAPDFDAIPTGGAWDGNAQFQEGVRVKVLDFTGGTTTEFSDDRQAARASLRLQVPGSIQVEQVQNFSLDLRQRNQDGDLVGGDAANDMRLAFTIRDHNGNFRPSIGQFAAMLHLVETDSQILLTKPCPNDVAAVDATEPREVCTEYDEGIEIPGHVSLTLYTRDNLSETDDGQLRSSTLLQVDGRITTPAALDGTTGINIGARLLGNDFAVLEGDPTGFFANGGGDSSVRVGTAEVVLRNLPGTNVLGSHVYEPDFRFRTELVNDGAMPEDDPDPSTFSEEGTIERERDNEDGLNEWYEFTLNYDVGIQNVLVGFDMNPNGAVGTQAKQLDAVIFVDAPRIGADLAAFTAIGGSTPAEISVGASVAITPLDVDISSHSNVGANLNQIVQNFIEEEIGAPDWLADIIGVIISPITSAIDAILNLFDLGVRLQSDLLIQFTVDRLSEFGLRNNILHVNLNGAGAGQADFGPINWYIDEFAGGVDLEIPAISIPDWICWVPGIPCSIGGWNILLAGYSYLEGIPAGSFGLPIAMDFRDCDALGGFASIVPFAGGGFDNTVTLNPGAVSDPIAGILGGNDEDFVMWVGTDPRMSFSGLLVHALDVFTFGGFSTVLDLVIDIVVGPILCNIEELGVDEADYVTIGTGHPGTPNPALFAGHPVPGQIGTDLFRPEGTEDPPVGPILFPPEDPSSAPEPEPIVPPEDPLPPLYAGDPVTVSTAASLCGVHEMGSLTLAAGADIAVAAVANPATDAASNPLGTGQACPAGSEGTLELRANTITVDAGATIDADGTSDDVPNLSTPFLDDFRAEGSSGGTNAGVGFDGSAPDAGFLAYTGDGADTIVYPGGPGSSVGTGFDLQTIAPTVATPDTVDSAGAGGNGGGAVILKADTLLSVAGTITADGVDGAGSSAGECDSDPFEDPGNDIYDEDDNLVEQVADDPDYEHVSGTIGAGGGAGGGIALQARTQVTVTGTLSALGGDGGSGFLGAGGGGGGGAIKILAPVVSGAPGASAVAAGTSGGVTCAGIPGATAPTFDDPNTAPVETVAQETDGILPVFNTPSAALQPYGPDWWAGGDGAPYSTFDGYVVGGGNASTTVNVCAVYVPLGSFYDADPYVSETNNPFTPWDENFDDPVPTAGSGMTAAMNTVLPRVEVDEFGNQFVVGTLPSAGDPCGNAATDHTLSGAVDLILVGTTSMSGAVLTPDDFALDIDTSGLYGLYTTAVRTDDGDGVADEVEALTGVEWATKVDATRPNVEISDPVDDPTPTKIVAAVTVDYVADDIHLEDVDFAGFPLPGQEFTLSGLDRVECRIYDQSDPPAADEGWARCTDGQVHELLQPDGTKVIETRAFDNAGNVSSLTDNVDNDTRDGVVDVILDISPPTADLFLEGGTQGGAAPDPDGPGGASPNWYRVAPGIRITDYASESPSGLTPYVYRFDNGAELACPDGGSANPPDCVLTSAQVDALLATGSHTVHYSAVNAGGNRYRDDNDGRTPSPMPFEYLFLDTDEPLVEVTTVPLRPDRSHLGQDWYDDPVVVVLAALDPFGGSGLDELEYRFGLLGAYSDYDPNNPPMAPAGESDFCYRVDDVAGNEVADCVDLRVDSMAPAFSLTPDFPADGEAGWYVTPPTFTVTGYDDGADGVGADADHFRSRFDNSDAIDCDGPSCPVPFLIGTGEHLVHASAADRFENRAGEQTIPVNVDLEPPVVVPIIGPAEPDGSNGWWHTSPFLTLFAVDPGEGSGVDTLEFSLDNGATWTTWTEPVRVGAGEHTLCWRGDDVAGNDSEVGCRDFFVDLDDPTTTVSAPAAPPSGWFTSDVLFSTTSADAVPGSGLGTDPDDVCADVLPSLAATELSGTCISVDGGPYVAATGDVTASEGIHLVRAYSVDRSGRRSAVSERVVRIDQSAPVVELRLLPPDPARAGWYRVEPLVVLRADDGEDGSGVTSLRYRVDGGAWVDYEQPFELPEGIHTVETRASDLVGSRDASTVVRVDTTAPKVVATTPSKVIWLRLLGLGGTNDLRYTIADNLSGKVRITVTIYDATLNPVRSIDGGVINVVPGAAPIQRSVAWDGRDGSLLNLVPLGVYTYRVTATDDAGNVAFSGESRPITIRVL